MAAGTGVGGEAAFREGGPLRHRRRMWGSERARHGPRCRGLETGPHERRVGDSCRLSGGVRGQHRASRTQAACLQRGAPRLFRPGPPPAARRKDRSELLPKRLGLSATKTGPWPSESFSRKHLSRVHTGGKWGSSGPRKAISKKDLVKSTELL